MAAADLIGAQVKRLEADFKLHPVTATEIEFYLHGSDSCKSLPVFWEHVSETALDEGIIIFNMGKEDAQEQHEISLCLCPDPIKTATDTQVLKAIIDKAAAEHGMKSDFSASPFPDRSGSGLHIHVHLNDTLGRNVFFKDDQSISEPLRYSIGGMLAWMQDSMPVFAPRSESYARYAAKRNAPLTVSWGANNRTVAVRLPQGAHENKHIEHRVSGADADPAMVIAVVLASIHYGLKNKSDPGAQIYGDASLPMYNLPRLPMNLEEALQRMQSSKIVAEYFSVADLLLAR